MSKYSDNINLKSLINNNDYKDNTEHIRKAKISGSLRKDSQHLHSLKQNWKGTQEELIQRGQQECNFLYTHHTDIFNRITKNELDMGIFGKIVDALESIENGSETQDTASANIGQLLADLYVNSAIKRGENLDAENGNSEGKKISGPAKPISWKEYKKSFC